MRQKTLGIIVGRFQPLHKGHEQIILKAEEQCDYLVILVGSANAARTIKNPWTYRERHKMITDFLNHQDLSIEEVQVLPLNDYKYSDTQWMQDVQQIADMFPTYKQKILFGFEKEGNDYLQWFPQFQFKNLESTETINATRIRQSLMSEHSRTGVRIPYRGMYIPEDVQADFEYFEQEKEKFKDYPYPETLSFNCADALVECNGHVLLIKRKFAPGRNTWALPGGFKNTKETFKETALRELYEETNIRVPEKVMQGSIVGSKLFDSPTRGNGIPRCTLVVHYKIAPDTDGKLPRANGADDAAECKWVPISEAINSYRLFDDHCDIIQDMTQTKAVPAFYNSNYFQQQ